MVCQDDRVVRGIHGSVAAHGLMSTNLCELVVDRADDPTRKKAQHKCVAKADDAAKEGDPVAWEKIGEQTQVCADVLTAFQYQEIGHQEQAGSKQNAKDNAEESCIQKNNRFVKLFFFLVHLSPYR